MKTSSVLRATALAASLLAAATASQAATSACDASAGNLVANCGFEVGDFTGWTLSGYDVTAGTLGSVYGVESGTDPYDGLSPHSGSDQAFFANLTTNPLTLTQTIATTAGAQYTVSFYLAQDTSPGGASGYVNNSFTASFAGVTGVSLSNEAMQGYTLYTFTGTATGSSTVLSFTTGNDLGQYMLDDVSVTAAVVPVPEPNPALMLAAGLGVLGFLRARRC